jgi:quercetin dioxygenase-like cupin family protein
MSSLERPLAGSSLTFDLREQLAELRSEDAYRRSGRTGRTLAKSGRLRMTMVALADGVEVGTHHADSPLTIHVLEGGITYRVEGEEHALQAGQVLYFGPGEAHDIRAVEDSALLLTISAIRDDFQPDA